MADTTQKRSGAGRGRIVAIIVCAVVAALYVAGIILFQASQNSQKSGLSSETPPADHLQADILASTVDPIKGDLVLRITVTPDGGDLVKDDGVTLKQPVDILVNAATGKSSLTFKAGERINPIDAVISLDDAGGALYPFDKYHGVLTMTATTGPAPSSSGSGSGSTGTAASAPLPIAVSFDGSIAGYSTDATGSVDDSVGFTEVDATVKRAPVTILFAVGVLLLQVIIGIGVIYFSVSVFRGKRKAEMAQLTWFSALLFAVTPLRNAMPYVPPIGILMDVLVYLWVVAAISVALLLVLKTVLFPPKEAAS